MKKNSKTGHSTALCAGVFAPFAFSCFDEYIKKLRIDRETIIEISGIGPRTLQRYINEDCAPQWLYIILYCKAGYILEPGWQQWRFYEGQLWGLNAPATKHAGYFAQELVDLAARLQHTRLVKALNDELRHENTLLREAMIKADARNKVPHNVIPFNGVTYQQIAKHL